MLWLTRVFSYLCVTYMPSQRVAEYDCCLCCSSCHCSWWWSVNNPQPDAPLAMGTFPTGNSAAFCFGQLTDVFIYAVYSGLFHPKDYCIVVSLRMLKTLKVGEGGGVLLNYTC